MPPHSTSFYPASGAADGLFSRAGSVAGCGGSGPCGGNAGGPGAHGGRSPGFGCASGSSGMIQLGTILLTPVAAVA